MKQIFLLLLFVTTITFIGCTSNPLLNDKPINSKFNPEIYYKQELCFTFETGTIKKEKIKNFFKRFKKWKYRKNTETKETVTFCGTGVLPNLDTYNLTLNNNSNKIDFFSMASCHEETTTREPNKGIFKKNGIIKIEYTPTIEKGRACPLFFTAYSKKGLHAWATLTFENPRYQLPATVYCNGHIKEYNGVSICQSRKGLIQKITFAEPVKLLDPVNGPADRKKDCPILGKDYNTSYTFKIPSRECFYGFIGKNTKKVHKLLTIGYEDIIIGI